MEQTKRSDFRQLGPKAQMSEMRTFEIGTKKKSELYVTEQAFVQILALFGFWTFVFQHSTVTQNLYDIYM